MAEKQINGRIVHKHDTEANWNKATNFIPKNGEIIIYDPDSNYSYARVKVGDGTTKVTSLPFIDNAIKTAQTNLSDTVNSVKNNSITGLSVSGQTITYTKGNGTTGTITTQDNNTTYSAGTGLSLSGTTFNHKNSITAATAQGDASKTLAFGDTFTIPTITYDAQGHITGKGTTTMTMPAGPVAKKGNLVSEIGIEGVGFSAKTTFEPKQEGSGEPSPDNIRPISGFNSAKLTRCGKNLINLTFAQSGLVIVQNADGTITATNNTGGNLSGARCEFTGILPAGTYTISKNDTNADVFLQTNSTDYSNNITTYTFVYDGVSYLRVLCSNIKAGASVTYKIQLEKGSTVTAYEPYQGNTYSADFGQTVYGGTLDWNTGVLTVDRASVQFMPTEISAYGSAGYSLLSANNLQPEAVTQDLYSVCDRFKRDYVWQTDAEYYYVTNDSVYLFSNRWTTLEEAKTWFTDNPTIMVYKLATPTTIQLTPQDLRMLDGTNTVYSDGITNYVIFNSGASSLGKAYELFFKKTDTIPVSNGGTDSTTASGARTALEVPSKTGDGASGTWGIDITGSSNKISYSTQLTTDDAINAFNTGGTFQVSTWNNTSSPGVDNGIIINAGWVHDMYGAQIAIDDDPTYYIALRQRDNNGWKAWKRIPMGDGTGASGTWGISISGNAGSVAWGNITDKPSFNYLPLSGGTLTGYLTLQNDATYPRLLFKSNSYNDPQGEMFYRILSDEASSNFLFRQYCRSSEDYSLLSTYEDFKLPQTTADRAYSGYYDILTTKSAVTVAQGGTGASTAAGARENLGIIASTTAPSNPTDGMIWLEIVS